MVQTTAEPAAPLLDDTSGRCRNLTSENGTPGRNPGVAKARSENRPPAYRTEEKRMRGNSPSVRSAKRRALRKALRAAGILKGARRRGGGLR